MHCEKAHKTVFGRDRSWKIPPLSPESSPVPSLIELVKKYREAKELEEALEVADELLRAVGPRLEAFLFRSVPPDEAPDIFLETLSSIYKSLPQFTGESDGQFFSWCRTILWRRITDYVRKKGPGTEPLEAIDVNAIERLMLVSSRSQALMRPEDEEDLKEAEDILRALPKECLDYVWKHYIDDWTFVEIAEAYGKTAGAVRMRVERCLNEVREKLKKRRRGNE